MNEVQLIDKYLKRLTKKNKSSQGLNDDIFFDKSKPDGMKLKMLSNKIINKTGWRPKTKLVLGLKKTYDYYKSLLKNNYGI